MTEKEGRKTEREGTRKGEKERLGRERGLGLSKRRGNRRKGRE